MRTFASVDTFVESPSRSLRLGRLVANATFLEALLRHGPFQKHVLFCPSLAERRRLEEFLQARPDGAQLRSRCELRLQMELPGFLRDTPPDVLHVGGWSRYLPALAWLRERKSPTLFPLTGIIHSLNDLSMPAGLARLAESPLRSCDSVFCTSRDGGEAFRRQLEAVRPGAFRGELHDVPLGVDARAFAAPPRPRARERASLPAEPPVLLWMGRLAAATKADLVPLLYQFRLILSHWASGPKPILVLAGGGGSSDVANLRAVVGELGLETQVRLRPDVEDDEKLALLGAADVFVSPVDNHQETFGLAVVEAMAAGLPVVCSDWDGYKDLVEHGVTGLRIPTLWAPPPPRVAELRGVLEPDLAQLALSQAVVVDPAALRRSLEELLVDPARARLMGAAGRERALHRFSWEAVIRRTSQVWEELRAEASRLPWPPPERPGVDPGLIDMWECFSHYPTRTLADDLGVRISELGREILAGRLPMPATYEDVVPLHDGRILTLLVTSLRDREEPLGAHAEQVARRLGSDPDETRHVLAWLLKTGILETL